MIVVDTCGKLSSLSKVLSQIIFFIAFKEAIYSASTDKVAIVSYFLEDHEIALLVTLNTKPLIEY